MRDALEEYLGEELTVVLENEAFGATYVGTSLVGDVFFSWFCESSRTRLVRTSRILELRSFDQSEGPS